MASKANMIALQSSEGKDFYVEEAVALQSQTIKYFIEEENWEGTTFSLPNVSSKILEKVIEYCKRHADPTSVPLKLGIRVPKPSKSRILQVSQLLLLVDENSRCRSSKSAACEELKNFDAGFVQVDRSTLFDLVNAANYLNIKSLLDLTCSAVADIIKTMSAAEIAKIFNLENGDCSPEEEEKIKEENQWAFE